MSQVYEWIKMHKFISGVSFLLILLVGVNTVLIAQFVLVLNGLIS